MDPKYSKIKNSGWEGVEKLIHDLKHYLPSQAPLKDFIHHNSLHAFQEQPFFQGIKEATDIFGYRTTLGLSEYRKMFDQGRISPEILEKVVNHYAPSGNSVFWKEKMLVGKYQEDNAPRIGKLRAHWHQAYNLDLETFVQPVLFRILCSYLDQGISIWDFPVSDKGFLASIREMEESSYSSFFKSKLAKQLLQQEELSMEDLLARIVGSSKIFTHYVFDQQFSHQGWSGMVSVVENLPQSLLISRKISLPDLIIFELLLELDTLEDRLPGKWKPLSQSLESELEDLFAKEPAQELDKIRELWQRAFEWSFYDQVIAGFALTRKQNVKAKSWASFQAVLCIDDRECSYRRYLERFDSECQTFGTPGFFGIEFYFQPKGGKFFTKVCPAPVTPKYLIKEIGIKTRLKKDITFSKQSHSLVFGWFISQTIGFWSALKLFFNIFRPTMGPATASSLKHMDSHAKLLVENRNPEHIESGLQVGFNVDEMAIRVCNMLKSIGLVRDFAPIVYIIGHGASSVNNPHYAAYDCGACSGRAGSVNARAFSYMANHVQVRAILREKGIDIPDETQFIGAIRDTTRDEIVWFDLETLYPDNKDRHIKNQEVFYKSLDFNAKERSRRFNSINSGLSPAAIHEKILTRSVSLFEPRPELNHATNAICIVGRRSLSKGLFLDRRSFLNSYDYLEDPEGNYLLNILNAAAPVCGGINLEYYFSRVDNQKLGAGTKLPHNVMGLFGVANGIDGDLRPGLPSQMIEMHDPVRLLMVVEHFPEIVLNTIRRNPATFEWFENEWVVLIAVDPESGISHYYEKGGFSTYEPLQKNLEVVENVDQLLESSEENFPVMIIAQKN